MPITINGNGAISGLGDIDGHDLETATLVVSGDTTIAAQAVGRATLFVDESANSVGINTTTPSSSAFLEVADVSNPVVVLNNTGAGDLTLGCTTGGGYIGPESNHNLTLQTNGTTRLFITNTGNVGIGTITPTEKLDVNGGLNVNGRIDSSSIVKTTSNSGFQSVSIDGGAQFAFRATDNANNNNIELYSNGTAEFAATLTIAPDDGRQVELANSPSGGVIYMRTNGGSRNITLDSTNGGQALIGTSSDTGARVFIRSDNTTTDIVNSGALTTTSTFGVALQNLSGVNGSYMPLYWRISNGSATQGVGLSAQSVSSGTGAQLVCHRRNNNTQAINWITTSQGNISFPTGQGIDFSASEGSGATSSVLDDYEEGEWTLQARDNFSAGNQGSFASEKGYYTKTGNMVTVWGTFSNVDTTGMNPTFDMCIAGLPFAATNVISFITGACSLGFVSFDGYIVPRIEGARSSFRFTEVEPNSTTDFITVSQFSSSADTSTFTLTYFVN